MSGFASPAPLEIDDRAHRAAREAVRSAEIVVWLTDANTAQPPPEDVRDAAAARWLIVLNKIDAASPARANEAAATLTASAPISLLRISARTGEGCDGLLAWLDERLHFSDSAGSEDVLLSADLRAAVAAAADCLDRALDLTRASGASLHHSELIAAELHEAAARLGRLTGETDVEELYDRIFSRFCVGK